MPNNVQRSNTRQGACIYCHQTGHSSGNCPSQSSGPRSSRPQSMNVQSGMTAELPFIFFEFIFCQKLLHGLSDQDKYNH